MAQANWSDGFALSYPRGCALIDILPGARTPGVFACYPGSGVRTAPNCLWDSTSVNA